MAAKSKRVKRYLQILQEEKQIEERLKGYPEYMAYLDRWRAAYDSAEDMSERQRALDERYRDLRERIRDWQSRNPVDAWPKEVAHPIRSPKEQVGWDQIAELESKLDELEEEKFAIKATHLMIVGRRHDWIQLAFCFVIYCVLGVFLNIAARFWGIAGVSGTTILIAALILSQIEAAKLNSERCLDALIRMYKSQVTARIPSLQVGQFREISYEAEFFRWPEVHRRNALE